MLLNRHQLMDRINRKIKEALVEEIFDNLESAELVDAIMEKIDIPKMAEGMHDEVMSELAEIFADETGGDSEDIARAVFEKICE